MFPARVLPRVNLARLDAPVAVKFKSMLVEELLIVTSLPKVDVPVTANVDDADNAPVEVKAPAEVIVPSDAIVILSVLLVKNLIAAAPSDTIEKSTVPRWIKLVANPDDLSIWNPAELPVVE